MCSLHHPHGDVVCFLNKNVNVLKSYFVFPLFAFQFVRMDGIGFCVILKIDILCYGIESLDN